jgi:pimeloyl-ACP methyl ester carboxylesterase
MSQIIFSHANGFPASTYRLIFQGLRRAGHHVDAIECIGHDPSYPVSSNWPMLVKQLAALAKTHAVQQTAQATWLLGHSLGGYLSMLCAARNPKLECPSIAGVIVLDAPIIGGWKARGLRLIKRSPLVGALLPGRLSRKRRRQWPDKEAVLHHFQHKRPFRRWDPRVLEDYVNFGTRDALDRQGFPCRRLVFDRDIETLIYNTVPDHLERYFKSYPIECPLFYLGGAQSREAKQIGLESTRQWLKKLPHSEIIAMEGSHLFPMEYPEETLRTILKILS